MITTDVNTGGLLSIDISPNSNYIAVAGVVTSIWVFPFSGSTFGSRFRRSTVNGSFTIVTFSPSGNLILSDFNGFEGAFFSDSGFVGGNIDVSRVRMSDVKFACFSPSGDALAVAYDVSRGSSPIRLYRFTTGNSRVSNQFADPGIPPEGPIQKERRSIAFSPSGDAMAVIHSWPPYITVYKITYNVP
jgi:WD40 repeat protein